jgi:peroxiredoxin
LAEWEEKKVELEELDCTIYAISVDTLEQAQEVVGRGLTFPVAYGCTKADADAIDAWWGDHSPDGEHIQPAEFLLGRGGMILGSMYASGQVGRMSADEAVRLITGRERRRLAQEAERAQNPAAT